MRKISFLYQFFGYRTTYSQRRNIHNTQNVLLIFTIMRFVFDSKISDFY